MKTGGNGVVYAEINTCAMNDITKDCVLLSKIHFRKLYKYGRTSRHPNYALLQVHTKRKMASFRQG